MSTIHLGTIVYDTPGRGPFLAHTQWVVHWCQECRTRVATADLVAHARAHGDPPPEAPRQGAAIE